MINFNFPSSKLQHVFILYRYNFKLNGHIETSVADTKSTLLKSHIPLHELHDICAKALYWFHFTQNSKLGNFLDTSIFWNSSTSVKSLMSFRDFRNNKDASITSVVHRYSRFSRLHSIIIMQPNNSKRPITCDLAIYINSLTNVSHKIRRFNANLQNRACRINLLIEISN